MPRRAPTAFEKGVLDYRKRILVALSKALLGSPILTLTVLYTLRYSLDVASVLISLASVPLGIVYRSRYVL